MNFFDIAILLFTLELIFNRYISERVGWSHKSNYEQREIVDKAIKRKNEEIL